MDKPKAIIKFNNGMGAVLCSGCRIILREGFDMTEDDWKDSKGEIHMAPQYCDKCSLEIALNHFL
jgi:hypothetical protein